MPTMPKSVFWSRIDTAGSDHALFDDRRGLSARGVGISVDPLPYTCRYELVTDETWSPTRLEVSVEGAGWLRTLRLERAAGQWRASTAEQGDLAAALRVIGRPDAGLPGTEDPDQLGDAIDVDLGNAPLFNTLPVRRLGLLDAEPGTAYRLTVVWVQVPSLVVIPAEQVYTALGSGRVRFASEGFTTDLQLDANGYVEHYPGLAERHEPTAR